MSGIRDLYEEMILDHNRHPRNFQKNPENSNRHAHGYNPICGDEFTINLTVEDGIIVDAGFEGAGCAISTASASMMTESLIGKTEKQAQALFEGVHTLLTHDDASVEVGKLKVLSGVKDYPARVKCATLAWHTMRAALRNEGGTVTTE